MAFESEDVGRVTAGHLDTLLPLNDTSTFVLPSEVIEMFFVVKTVPTINT